MKSIITTAVGFFTFGGVVATPLTLTGVSISTVGAVGYACARYNDKQQKQARKQEEKSKTENV